MRQGQQNRRGRGRNNNNQNHQNRKGQNPLTRSFESNGPDMKIRGNPAHIAEKYIALARDAHSSGDPVLAENYLQHAEHYNRIILAYREQQLSQGGSDMGGVARPRPAQLIDNTDGEDMGEDDGFGAVDPADMPQPSLTQLESGQPQPQGQTRNFGGERFDNRPQRDRQEHQQHRQHRDRNDRYRDRDRDRGERFGGAERQERHPAGEGMREPREYREPREPREPREYREPREPREPRAFQGDRPPAFDRPPIDRAPDRVPDRGPERAPVEAGAEPSGEVRPDQPRRRERFAGSTHEQPEFLRRPVRRPRREGSGEGGEAPPPAPAAAGSDEPGND